MTQPLLQRWAVSLSPVVNLLAIVAFGIIFGVWGAVLATPMAVALSVLIRMAYVEDVLEARPRHGGLKNRRLRRPRPSAKSPAFRRPRWTKGPETLRIFPCDRCRN